LRHWSCLFRMPLNKLYSSSLRMSQVKKNLIFWIGTVALSSLLGFAPPADAQTKSTRSKSGAASASKPTVKRSTRYSAARSRSRRAALARARAVALAKELAESVPRYKTDASGAVVPDLHAEAAIIYDPKTNEILWEQNSQALRSIASITKVMTATVFLEDNPDLTQPVTIVRSDVLHASTTPPRARSRASRRSVRPASSIG
jgi:D-alanyl-D-alanine carboxypeptidase